MKASAGIRCCVAVLACGWGCVHSGPAKPSGPAETADAATPAAKDGEQQVKIDLPRRVLILPEVASEPAEPAEPEAPPATDIFLIDFDTTSQTWRPTGVRRVTDREAYDNQPYFESDGSGVLYTSYRDGQTDIFRYRLDSQETERLTDTEESEYSPTPVAGPPGFSTVRVEGDGTQRLWRFPAGSGEGREPELVFPEIAPVGYHAWIDAGTVAMFVLGEPHELVIGDLLSQESGTVASDIGRALHRVPRAPRGSGRRAVSFVDKSEPERWLVSVVDLATGETEVIAETPSKSEDFVFWSDHEILIGQGSKLFLFDLESSGDLRGDGPGGWREVADLSEFGVRGITRLSPSPSGDVLAVVGDRGDD